MDEDKLKKKIIKKYEGDLEEALVQYEYWRVKCSTLDKLVKRLKTDIGEEIDD